MQNFKSNDDLLRLPPNLPIPIDDGQAQHLEGSELPDIELESTDGDTVCLAGLPGLSVVFCYPLTCRPNVVPPADWDDIPGARGCTPQCWSYRAAHPELVSLGVRVFGLSVQDTGYQLELVQRLGLPFPVLSDSGYQLTKALRLPKFAASGMTLLKRLTFVSNDGFIEKIIYPVFPATSDVNLVLAWLKHGSIIR